MKSFKDVIDEQSKYGWMKPLLDELQHVGFALEVNYWERTIYIFGDKLPQALGYDKLGEYLNDYKLGEVASGKIKGNSMSASISYSAAGPNSDEGTYFNDFIAKNALYIQDFGNDGNHPSGWHVNK